MKWLHRFFGLLILLLVAAQGIFALYGVSPAGRGRWNMVLRIASQETILVLMGGMALCLLVSLYLLTFPRDKSSARTISYNGPNGPITVGMRAVRDFIHRIGAEFPEIVSLQSNLDFRHNALYAELDLRVTAGSNLPELCRMLQERVAENIRDQLGLAAVKGVRVNVRELIQRPAAPGPDAEYST